MTCRWRLALAVIAATSASGGFAAANVPAEPTQIAGNARDSYYGGAIAIADTRLAWEGVDPLGDDFEIFLANAAEPIAESIELCPLTNPCQLTNDDADDVAPRRSGDFVAWQRKDLSGSDVSLHFSDGNQSAAVPGSADPNAFLYGDPLALSGWRLVWWGADGAGSDGIFLADLAQPLATGATSLCPLTNPCRIATVSATSVYEESPRIDGTRVVWSARTGAGEDKEIHLFDATRPADAAPPLACPLSNPCLLTENDRADSEPIVSASLVAWAQCEGADCLSFPPDRLVFNDGAETIEVAGDWAGVPVAIEGTHVAWAAVLSVILLDTSVPIELSPFGYPLDCPIGNPCFLDATGVAQMAGPWLFSSNESDVVGIPIDLLLFDLRRSLEPRPFTGCPGTNPCFLRNAVEGARALSTDAIAWLECPADGNGCEYPYSGSFDLYVVPEPDRVAAGSLALAVLAAAARRRAAAPA